MRSTTKRPPKTLKEKKFLKIYAETGNATEAAAQVYDVKDRDSANALGSETLAKLSIVDILDKAGVTDEKIAQTVLDGMEANKPISAVAGKDASEASVDFIDVPDWTNRLKATELASKMKGHMKEKVEHSGSIVMPIYGGKSKV